MGLYPPPEQGQRQLMKDEGGKTACNKTEENPCRNRNRSVGHENLLGKAGTWLRMVFPWLIRLWHIALF